MQHDSPEAEIAIRLRRRAFRSRDPRIARRLLALADEVPTIRFTDAPRVLATLRAEDRRYRRPKLRVPRFKPRRTIMTAKVRHPLIMKQLGEILPPGPRKPETLLGKDLGLGPTGKANLATEVERAWRIAIPESAIATWRTIADVAETIATAAEMASA